MDGGDDMDSLFEGMELFTPSSSQFSDNSPAVLPSSKEAEATLNTAPSAETTETMNEPLDEDMFSDLTIVSPVQHVTHPPPLSSSSSSSSVKRQVSRRKKRAGGLRIGYGRHETNDEEDDDSVSQQSTDSVSQFSDSVNQVTDSVSQQSADSVSQQSDSVNQVTDSVSQEPDSVVDQPLDSVKAQIEGKLTRARDLAASVTSSRKNAIRKRRQASENLRLASKAHDELEKQLEEAIDAEDFDAAEKISESLAAARRVLSFSKRKKQKLPGFQDSDSIRSSPFRASQVQGPKPSEVYGFVGSISTVVATVIFLIWAYVPDKLLESIGIHYYPSRYWVLAMPTYLMVTLLLGLAFYIGLNFIATPHPTSLNTLFDEYSREPGEIDSQMEEGDERPIDPISDIDITIINDLMFNSSDVMCFFFVLIP